MARQDRDDVAPPAPKSRWGKRLAILAIAMVVIVGLLPTLLLNRSVIVPLANRFGGLAPLKIDIESVHGGWLSPMAVKGISVTDESGKVLVRVAGVKTEKSIFGWASNSSNLGTITLSGIESIVVCQDGTTSLEEALKPLLVQAETPAETTDANSTAAMEGTLVVTDSKLLLTEAGRPEKWVVEIPSASMRLPAAGQWLGPIKLQAVVGDASGTHPGQPGSIAAQVQQSADSPALVLDAAVKQIPLEFWHVVRARLPSLPIDDLQGRFSATVSGQLADAEHWSIDAEQINATGLRIAAPTLVGPQPATLQMLSTHGKASLDGQRLLIDGVQLQCDFANAAASGSVPWPIVIPTMANPMIPGAIFDARGTIDLPKLVSAAETLIPVRDDLQLKAGTAQFILAQQETPGVGLGVRGSVRLAGLQAISAGQTLDWQTPLSVDVDVTQSAGKPTLAASATADFCSLTAGGDLEAGKLAGSLDLARLYAEASRWIELPIRNMTGNVSVHADWKMADSGELVASGSMQTSPLVIASATGQEISEPAWQGTLAAVARMEEAVPTWINSASFQLKSSAEQLSIDLQQPLRLSALAEGESAPAPAAFSITLDGDLNNWKRRSLIVLTEPLPVDISGNINLAVGGRLDMQHVEVSSANWNAEPLQISTEQMSFSENRMIGSFKGLVDTNDFMKLAIDELKIQSTSLSVEASDSLAATGASAGGTGGRTGQASFRVDLGRLMNNMQQPAGAEIGEAGQITATGMLAGQLNWTVASEAASFAMQSVGNQIVVVSRTQDNPAGSPLWDEPDLRLACNGKWISTTGRAELDNVQLQTPWLTYAGTLAYESPPTVIATSATASDDALVQFAAATNSTTGSVSTAGVGGAAVAGATGPAPPQTLAMRGQLAYDCGLLAQKLIPFTGGQVSMQGTHTAPVQINWTSSSDPDESVLASLDAATQIGWQQAQVAGLDVGQATVPISVAKGRLTSKTEIPVSGGVMRWDLASDLTADDLTIDLQPMTVLENVAITEQMCSGWLKYVAPLVAEATSIDGRLTLRLDQAKLTPSQPANQTVAGQLQVHNAQVGPGPMSTQILALVSQIDSIRKGSLGQSQTSQQTWLLLPEQKIDFKMVDGLVHHKNLNVRVGDANISTSGSVGVTGQMNMVAEMPIPDDWVDKSPLLASMRGQSLRFPVKGTVTQPQIDTDFLRQFGQQAAQGAAQGLIQQGLSRGLEKLFGPPPSGGN